MKTLYQRLLGVALLFASTATMLQAAINLPGRLQAEDYDNNGSGISFFDDSPTNQGGSTYRNDAVDIETCSEGGYDVGYIGTGEWLRYAVNVTQSGYYNITLRVASQQNTGKIRLEWDGSNITGSAILPNTTGWQTWQDVKLSYVYLTAGAHSLRVIFDGYQFNFNYIDFTLNTTVAAAPGNGFIHRSNTNFVNNNGTFILKGVNLGCWMVQEGYILSMSNFANAQHEIRGKIEALIGTTKTNTFYDSWLNNWISKRDIDSIKSWGFNHVRLPMHYNLFTPLDQPDVYTEKGFAYVDSIVKWCRQNQMYVVLDLHATPGGQSNNAISDYDAAHTSFWDDAANRDKAVKLWTMIAQRYANEQWIAGYDLINEPAWNLPNNQLLRDTYVAMTSAIRTVDNNHILLIEGNWYANDYTNLTPIWDNNMGYSFHKYWSPNATADIQFVLNVRNSQNVPIWMGEFGENSNQWNVECLKLINANNISWAVWPLKKYNSISCIVSVKDLPNYNTLLNYWNGSGAAPSAAFSEAALMELAQKSHISYCKINYDFLDALLRQPTTNALKPYANLVIPGQVALRDFDMGTISNAYFDNVYLTNTQSPFNNWNNGWVYRNDGVDMEYSIAEGNFTVGWVDDGEWMKYTLKPIGTALFDIDLRHAGFGGVVTLQVDGVNVISNFSLPSSGAWNTWRTTRLGSVTITGGTHTLTLVMNTGGANLHYLNFSTTTLGFTNSGGPTEDEQVLDGLHYFPVPAVSGEVLHVQYLTPAPKVVKLELYDPLGRLVSTTVYTYDADHQQTDMALQGLNAGMYTLRVYTPEVVVSRKVIVE